MNAEHEQLASAYLDGELTDEERRLADADPAVMADVERLRALRAGLADVEPPTDAARERAIAAAMASFGEIHGVTTATSPAFGSADAERGRHLNRWLGVAAAVVAVGLLGVVVATGLDGADDGDQSAEAPADDAAEEPAAAVMLAPAATQLGADLDAEAGPRTESADDGEAEMTMADEPATEREELAEEPAEAAAADPDEALADQSADAPSGGAGGDGATTSTFPAALMLEPEAYLDGEPMGTPAELVAVAEHLLDLLDRRELPPTPNHSCPFEDVLARGVFGGDDDDVDIYIAVDADVRTVLAIDEESCRVVLRADLDP